MLNATLVLYSVRPTHPLVLEIRESAKRYTSDQGHRLLLALGELARAASDADYDCCDEQGIFNPPMLGSEHDLTFAAQRLALEGVTAFFDKFFYQHCDRNKGVRDDYELCSACEDMWEAAGKPATAEAKRLRGLVATIRC